QRMGRNPFMRSTLLQRSHGRCARCGEEISNADRTYYVHHLTYEHECVYPELIQIPVARVRRGKPLVYRQKITQCEQCSADNPSAFAACAQRVIPLCRGCHFREHGEDLEQMDADIAAGHF